MDEDDRADGDEREEKDAEFEAQGVELVQNEERRPDADDDDDVEQCVQERVVEEVVETPLEAASEGAHRSSEHFWGDLKAKKVVGNSPSSSATIEFTQNQAKT